MRQEEEQQEGCLPQKTAQPRLSALDGDNRLLLGGFRGLDSTGVESLFAKHNVTHALAQLKV